MKVWIHINGIQEGPYELEQLPLNRIKPDTPVWYEGLDYWKEASKAPEVATLMSQAQAKAPDEKVESSHQDKAVMTEAESAIERGEAEAESAVERGEAEAEATIERGEAQAEAAVERGEAEAEAAIERGEAEAESAIERGEAEAESAIERGEADAEGMIEEKDGEAVEIVSNEAATVKNVCVDSAGHEEFDSQQQEPPISDADNGVRQPYAGQPYAGPSYGGQPYVGQPYYAAASNPAEENGKKAATYLIFAILLTLLCCNPIGIIAIITSIITHRRNSNYDYAGAQRMSEATAWWIMIVIVTSLIMAPFMTIISL